MSRYHDDDEDNERDAWADPPDDPADLDEDGDDERDIYFDLEDRSRLEGQQAIVGVDPMLEEYMRAPFDPLYAARVGGRLTGEVIGHPPKSGWLRLGAFVLALTFLVGSCGGVTQALGVSIAGYQLALPAGLGMAVVFALAGVLLLWRLLSSDRHER